MAVLHMWGLGRSGIFFGGCVPGKGMLYVEGGERDAGRHAEPNPDKRERIMGCARGCTAAPRVTAEQWHELMGKAMGRHAVTRLFSVRRALAAALGL